MKSVLVICGSSPGRLPEYAAAARELGTLLAQRRLVTVFGGGRVGMMGAVADSALAAGGEVIGVIPRRLQESEVAHAGLTELHVVETMHERKALMIERSDAVIALPGGIGTFDELFELYTWSQLGLHRKPIGILEVAGYWEPLFALLDQAVRERFLRSEHRDTLVVSRDAAALLDQLAAFKHEYRDKWLDLPAGDQAVPNTRSPASPKPGRM